MKFLPSFLLLLQGVAATPLLKRAPLAKRSGVSFSGTSPEAFAPAAPLVETSNVAALQKTAASSKSSKALHDALASGSAPLYPEDGGSEYAVKITFGTSTETVILDTGSSDTWLVQAGFKCVNINMGAEPESTCMFGPVFDGTFEDGQIADENFNITYGDGEFLTGVLGRENVTLAGITVKDQEVALVNYAYWEGDNVTSGLIGMAYPSLTSAFAGTNPAVDNTNTTEIEYSPFITSAINQSLISPMFSLALERGASGAADGGYVALGGLPPVTYTHDFVSTPIKIIQLESELPPDTATQYSFYTIIPEGFVLENEFEEATGYDFFNPFPSTNFPAIVDSGTTLIYLPTELAAEINDLYDPPSVYIEEEGVYENYCDATPPTFAVRINGTDFYINAADMILNGAGDEDPETGGCITGIQDGGTGPFILGDVFLKNVVAVFDVGASEMRFAKHENY